MGSELVCDDDMLNQLAVAAMKQCFREIAIELIAHASRGDNHKTNGCLEALCDKYSEVLTALVDARKEPT